MIELHFCGNRTFTQVKILCGLISEQFSFPFHSVQFTFELAPFSSSDIEIWLFLTFSLFNPLWSFPLFVRVHSRKAPSHICCLFMLILDELDVPTYVDFADSWWIGCSHICWLCWFLIGWMGVLCNLESHCSSAFQLLQLWFGLKIKLSQIRLE